MSTTDNNRTIPRGVVLCSVYVFVPALAVLALGGIAARELSVGETVGEPSALLVALCVALVAAPFCVPAMILQALALLCRGPAVARWAAEFFWIVFFLALLRCVVLGGYLLFQIPPALQDSVASKSVLPFATGLLAFSLLPTVLNAITARVMGRWSAELAGEPQ